MIEEWREAALNGDSERIRALLADGADIDAKDRYGQTALMIASKHGQANVASVLVEHRADLDVTAKFNLSAVMLAVVNRHGAIVETLVNAGADLSLRGTGAPGFFEKTALQLAEESEQSELADFVRRKIPSA